MLTSATTGLLTLTLVLVFWVTVQLAWRRVFGAGADPDPLAGRMGCHGTCAPHACARPCRKPSGPNVEDDRWTP